MILYLQQVRQTLTVKNAHLHSQGWCSQTQIGMLSFIYDRLLIFLSPYISLNFTTIMWNHFLLASFFFIFFYFPPFSFFLFFCFLLFPLALAFFHLSFASCILYFAFFFFPSYFLSSWISAVSFTVFSVCQKGKLHRTAQLFPFKGNTFFLIIHEVSQNHRMVEVGRDLV